MRTAFRVAGIVPVAAAMLVALALPTTASHSLPATPEFWDCNVDHVADMGCVKFHRAGTTWSVAAATRIAAAATEWRNDSAFNLTENTSSGQNVYRDRLGCGLTSWKDPVLGTILGATCRTRTWDGIIEAWRITSAKTYFNHQMSASSLEWYYGSGVPPNSDQIHFGGIAVHELGHWIFLKDIFTCTPGATMCGSVAGSQDSFDYYSLEADDVSAANSVY